jgi:1-acyl-sn-glycerol-3-phosphate acyltransferase
MRLQDWPFSRPATWAREVTARIFGPPLAWLIRGPAVRGLEHLAELEVPFMICPNHSSHLDSSSLRLALGPHFRHRLAIAAAADYFWRYHTLAFLAGWLGSFPFNRQGQGGAESIRETEHLLGQGWGVLIYPEGTRSRTGEIGHFKPGAGLIATRMGCQVLPVRINGTWDVWPPSAWLPRKRGRVEVRFGVPLRALPGESARQFTSRLESAVRSL